MERRASSVIERIVANVEKVIVGKRSEVELAVVALMCQGICSLRTCPG